MFEGLIADFLNKYVGQYVSNLDSSTLNLSIFKGDVELTDLQLAPEALAELNLPVEVKAGHIGHLKIDIPWTQLFTADIHVAIENVYIVAGPITDRQYDAERERQLQAALKRQLLERIEQSTLEGVVSKSNNNPSFVEKFTTSLLNRLQISVRHIHIRYEDTITNGDHAFACGVMLKQLLVCSTDSHWQPKGSDAVPNLIHKMLKMDDLSLYWNPYVPEQHLLKTRLNTDGWRNLLRMSIDSHTIFEEELDFIMEPVAAQARLIVNTDNNFTLPKLFMDFTIEEVEILLSRQQFLNLINLSDSFKLMRVNQRYRKYHPNISLKVSPRSWWIYAYSAVLEEVIRPYSWVRIRAHRNRFNQYKNLYKLYLGDLGNKSTQEKLKELEEHLDVTNILIAKEQAKLEFVKEAPDKAKQPIKKKKSWLSKWLWGSEEDDVTLDVETEHSKDWLSSLTSEEKEKLYAGIGYDDSNRDVNYPKKYVASKIQVILKRCCVSMVNYSKKILQVSVTHLLSTLEHRPGNNAFRISCNTESFAVEGASIEHELIPILTSDIGVYAPSVNQVFTLDFESKPLYMDADYSLSLNVQPVEIVYDEHSISEVTAFFQLPQGGLDIKSAAYKTLTNVAHISQAGLQYIIETHTTIHIALNMRSPYIVIPEYGTLHRGGNVLIIDLGTLRIESELQPKDVSLEDATMSEIESRLYDQFNMKISDVKVLLADSADDWHTAQIQSNSEFHILPSVQLIITFFNAVKPDFTQLPRHKLEAKIPSLEINISDKRMLLLATFFRNFPIPTSSSIATIGEDMTDSHGASTLAPFHLKTGYSVFDDSALFLDLAEAQLEPDVHELRCIKRSVLGRSLVNKVDGPRRSLSKVPTLMYTRGDEPFYSASDYSDEELDKLSDMLAIKSVDDNASVANTINMLMRMSLGELVVNLSKEMDKEEKAYLMIRIDRLRIDSALTVHGYAAYTTLGGIQLVDKIHVGHSGEYMEVLSTNTVNNNNLMSIVYRKVDPVCPDFATYYGGVEHAIKIKILSLSTLFDQASMMYLNAFLQSIMSSVQSLDMKTSSSSIMTTSEISMKDKVSIKKRITNITDQVDNLPSNGTKIHLIAELEDITIKLTDSDNQLAEVKVKGFEGCLIAKPSKIILRSRLKDLSIRDCSAGAIYQNILLLQDDSVFDLKLVKYNKSSSGYDQTETNQGLDYSIRLWLGQIQAAILGKFYWEITRFFEPFINQEMTETAKQTALHTVTKQVNDFQSNNLRVSINIQVRSPTLLLPHDSQSTEMLLVQLGNLNIRNSFLSVNLFDNVKQELNDIHINLSNIQVQRVCLNLVEDSTEIMHIILEPLSFTANIKLAMEPIVEKTKLDIFGHLEKVKVYILQKDIQLILGVLRYNLTESSPPPSPGIYESPTLQNLQGQQQMIHVELDQKSAELHTPDSPPIFEQKTLTKLAIKLDGLSVSLFTDNGKELATRTSLCFLGFEKISLSAIAQSDGELNVDVSLFSVDLNDTRPDSNLAFKRVLECVSKVKNADLPLVFLKYKISNDGNHKAELEVEKLQLNVNTPFMLVLLEFFNGAMDTVNQSTKKDESSLDSGHSFITPQPPQDVTEIQESPAHTSFTIEGSLKEPEVVLYADPTQTDSRVLILYSDVAFSIRKDVVSRNIWAKVTDLKLISKSSLLSPVNNLVLCPCCVELSQKVNIPSGASESTVSISQVQVFVSPSVMQLFWDVISSINYQETKKTSVTASVNDTDVQGLWVVSKVTSEKWLKDRSEVTRVPDLKPTLSPKESFHLSVKDINVYFEIETLDLHVPILCLHTSLQSKIEEWSRKMHIEAELHLEMMYFNETLSVWEPLLEPVMDKEFVYRPWELLIKVIRAKSFPMICMYDDNDVNIPEELQTEVQQMMHRSRVKSSSSETDDPSADQDMKVIRHKSLKRLRHGSDRSFDSSHHSSVQGESDSEPEGFISNMTSKLGSIFSSDSSDADVSETEENDDGIDMSLDKPVFLTSRGPVHMTTGTASGFDEVDAAMETEGETEAHTCLYVMLESLDRLQLNVTPQSIVVLKDVVEALTNPNKSELQSVRTMPRFKVNNELGLHAYITCHKKIKVHKDHIKNATIYLTGQDENIIHPVDYDDVIDGQEEENTKKDGSTINIPDCLAQAGHTLVSAGAFVFDDDDDYLSGNEIDYHRLKLQVEGFEQTPSILHKRSCPRLIPLTPTKSDEMELENGMKYCIVMEVHIWHGCKTVKLYSPLKLENHLTMTIDIYCKSEDLKKFKATKDLVNSEDLFSKLATVKPNETYHLPLFVAYHCPLYIKPSEIHYELTHNPLWWQDMLQGKDRMKNFTCLSSKEEKSFNFKAVCKEGDSIKAAPGGTRSLPYYTLHLYPPVVLHNFLPYDIQFSLQGTTMSSSLTHGDMTPLYTVETGKAYKLLITLPDYMGSDWTGTLEISPDMEEFRAITMETEIDSENVNRHLSLSIHADQSQSLDLRIYTPYWIVNKTDLPLQLRGSLSDAVYELTNSPNPLLFRFKKHKRKKAKLRVYESRWSQSFSADTVGSAGVVICNDKERGKKYMFLIQIALSKLRLTKLVTIMPFFLVINNSKQKLRYMEENEKADLWIDIDPDQYQPFWPVTESFNMYVKFDGSNVSSLHFPIKSCHNTVLRMDQGRALCVEVCGGTDTPITIIFLNYERGDAPVRVENLCEDVFIKIHQKNQSQVTLLSPNQSILYTWDEPSSERTLMWNVYSRKKPSFPAFITKDGSGEVRLSVASLKTTGAPSVDVTDAKETDDSSSPEDESDETDALIAPHNRSQLSHTRVDKLLIFWVSYLDGLQRVLLFTQDERVSKAVRKGFVQSVDFPRRQNRLQVNEGENADLAIFASLEGISISVINSLYQEVALLSVTSCPAVWEVEVKEKWRSLNVELATWLEDQWRGEVVEASLHDQIEADLKQMQMTKPFMGALRRTFRPGLWCQYHSSKHHMSVNITLQTLQIDNQLPDAYFPTALAPTPIPAYILRHMGPKPFIEVGLMRRIVPEENIDTIRYAKILVQEFNLKLDKGFILSVIDIIGKSAPVEKESFQLQCDLCLARQSLKEATTVLIASRPQKIFFEYIHLSPLKLHLSFSLHGKASVSSVGAPTSSIKSDIVDFFLNSLGVTLTEIKNVELRMAYFERKGVLLSSNQLMAQVQSHYIHQTLQQAYVLILGLDVLGNPYGLVKDFTQGLGDFFYEPFLGSIQGKDEFTDSLARGVQSLMGNTIGGTAGSVAGIAGSIGRTLAAISFDEDYKRKRRLRLQQEPSGLPASLALATRTLVMGVGLGLSGVILDPIKGAHEEGVEGFFKGVGKGILGLLTKPTGGVVDMVSMAFDGLRRTAEMEGGAVARMRLPRFINPHIGLQPFSPHKASGQRLLQSVLKGDLSRTDIYWAHAPLSREEKSAVVLITDRNLLFLEKCRFWGGWDVDWKVSLDRILGVPAIKDEKLIFKIKEDDSGVNLFSSGEKEIASKETAILEWLQGQISKVIKYNAQ
ncbi:intermembrane lipid transfer protein VPS13A-like isoform X3 [Biomphalaria glabrata]|uniref:Intermembrane lipid transfer protein VPS13A-like isoform X3 n=1 Tax=Biomphalaria glabrata TaxID=6526 RepID=A0A9W3AKG9_BIOGL|nr:intermembrane lipid transfer protein VPS13A-like isoform X3 [Biomphalaria glabrata]